MTDTKPALIVDEADSIYGVGDTIITPTGRITFPDLYPHQRGDLQRADMIYETGGTITSADFKLIEERMVRHMDRTIEDTICNRQMKVYALGMDYARRDESLGKAIAQLAHERENRRAPRTNDWQQRSKKLHKKRHR